MGRWQAALRASDEEPNHAQKNHARVPAAYPQNPQKSDIGGFEGFEGASPASMRDFFSAHGWDADDWRMAFEERAAIMEYDGGLSREDAERLARTEIDGLRWGA